MGETVPASPLPAQPPDGVPGTMATAIRPSGLPAVSLAELAALVGAAVDDVPIDVAVSGVTLRSAAVRPGDLFAALPGSTAHGATFAADAVQRGAVAILTDAEGHSILAERGPRGKVPVIVVPDPRAHIGPLAAHVYGDPSGQLAIIGVTGTSGKTTTCFLLEGALAAAGRRVGLIGTVGARIAGEPVPSALTTPEAPDLQALFAAMVQRGVDIVVMEVSSHALALGRVDGTRFAVGAFTNLSQDHLDFHGDMESYFAAKKLLFDGRARAEVIVVDDTYGRRLAADRPAAMTVSGTRAGSENAASAADWSVTAEPAPAGRQNLVIERRSGRPIEASISLPGAFNATNAATALACVAAAGIDPVAAAAGLAEVQVPGRLQRVDRGQSFLALVDYAHKPAAVAAVLDAVRPRGGGRVIVVLGAGGDRDHGKRPLMGEYAAVGADLVIVTDDNPRSEDPAAIRAAVLAGARTAVETGATAEIREVGDRRTAIIEAVAAARPGDVVVIAGKGHEQGQEIAGVTHHFSDLEELDTALAAREAGGAS